MKEYRIRDLPHYLLLWKEIYSESDGLSWNHLLPYYDEDIHFKDTVQEIRGIKDFTEMTKRLAKRSKNLEVRVLNSCMYDNLIFVEWEMMISYKNYPKTSIFGISRSTLRNGKIFDQRDYYDLWGDIFNNIKFLRGGYRRFMRRRFG